MKKKILCIENTAQNLHLVTFMLEKHGYEVYSATDDQKGIDRAARMKPDLILLDIQLPCTDGYAVARQLRANPDLATIPIVAVTSNAMDGDHAKTLDAGCSGYIEKPINPETFMLQVEQHLSSQGQ